MIDVIEDFQNNVWNLLPTSNQELINTYVEEFYDRAKEKGFIINPGLYEKYDLKATIFEIITHPHYAIKLCSGNIVFDRFYEHNGYKTVGRFGCYSQHVITTANEIFKKCYGK